MVSNSVPARLHRHRSPMPLQGEGRGEGNAIGRCEIYSNFRFLKWSRKKRK